MFGISKRLKFERRISGLHHLYKKNGIEELINLQNINEAVHLWIKKAEEFGDPIPKPKGRKLFFA